MTKPLRTVIIAMRSQLLQQACRVILPLILAVTSAGCSASASAGISAPIDDFALRTKLLTFGLHVTPDPEDNPINPPERFEGYHVATDFEVGTDELNTAVKVYAICTGEVVYSGFTSGYGGLVVQRCTFGKEEVTVNYGHLSLENLPGHGVVLQSGGEIAELAPARSYQSDGNRKHLHLGIHRGTAIDMRGYVQTEADVATFIDPLSVLPDVGPGVLQSPIEPYWKTPGL